MGLHYSDQIQALKLEHPNNPAIKKLDFGAPAKHGTKHRLQVGAWLLDRLLEGDAYSVEMGEYGMELRANNEIVRKSAPQITTSAIPFKPWSAAEDENGNRLVSSWFWQPGEQDFSKPDGNVILREHFLSLLKLHRAYLDALNLPPDRKEMLNAPLVYEENILPAISGPGRPAIFIQAINNLESVAYQVNNELLKIIRTLDIKRGRKIRAHRFFYDNDNKSRRKQFRRIINEAKFHGNGIFYHRAFLDYRGRIYLSRSGLNYQGPDEARALVEFHHGEKIKSNLTPLFVHAANMYGEKGTIKDRKVWGKKNRKKMVAYANNPYKHDPWNEKADKKFCFLRACIEIRDAYNNPNHITHLPIELDASNSGYQHCALMTNDYELAKLCNVIGVKDEFVDLYEQIAKIVRDKLSIKAELKEVRVVTKAIAVPRGHGSVEYGLKQILDIFVPAESWKDVSIKKMPPFFRSMSNSERESFLKTTLEAISEVAPAVERIKTFLEEAIDSAALKGQTQFSWETLSGFRVVVAKEKLEKKGGHRVGLNFKPYPINPIKLKYYNYLKDTLDKQKVKNAIAPNLVHSQDATLVHLVLAQYGTLPIVTIHDAFAALAPRVNLVRISIMRNMHVMYLLFDPLEVFARDAIHHDLPSSRITAYCDGPDVLETFSRISVNPYPFSGHLAS